MKNMRIISHKICIEQILLFEIITLYLWYQYTDLGIICFVSARAKT